MSDRRNVNSTEFSTLNKVAFGVGLGIAASAIIGTMFSNENNSNDTAGSKNQQKQSPPMLQTESKTKQSREDTNPNAVLKQITANNIKMNPANISKSNKIVEQFVRYKLMNTMKEVDQLFKIMYRDIYYTGSYYDGLRIENPDEYDLNIVLNLKLPRHTFRLVRNQSCSAGFVQLQVDNPERTVSMNMPMYGLVQKFIKMLKSSGEDDKYFVMPDAIRKWMNSVVDKALVELKKNKMNLNGIGILDVRRKTSGPATTLVIERECGSNNIDIDLVPVFPFFPQNLQFYGKIWNNIHNPQWLDGRPRTYKNTVETALGNEFFIVPKPSSKLESEWRLDFHDAEIKIIDNVGCAKPVIKFLKAWIWSISRRRFRCKPLYSWILRIC